jgi:hypothetical protein
MNPLALLVVVAVWLLPPALFILGIVLLATGQTAWGLTMLTVSFLEPFIICGVMAGAENRH